MRKLLILTFCFLFAACAGHRTLDGETTKNWVKIVSSKMDRSGNIQDVCYVFDLSFYPGTVYERLKNNPETCLEECCWYSENKSVDFYFNDGFAKDLEEQGISRRYYPDHLRINMTYSPFINRLSAKATSAEAISKDGIVRLEYQDVRKTEIMNDKSLYEVNAKVYPEEDINSDKSKSQDSVSYKTVSISGFDRGELLPKAQAERDEYYIKSVSERYESPEKEYVEESILFTGQVSPFDKQDKETKWLSKKTLAEEQELKYNQFKQNRYTDEEKDIIKSQIYNSKKSIAEVQKEGENKIQEIKKDFNDYKDMYDMQRPYYEKSKLVYTEPIMVEEVDTNTLALKLKYERKEAVKLLKRFYGNEIDAYLRALDKTKRAEGQVLFTTNKVWQVTKIGTTIYKVDCNVNGKIILLGTKADTETTDYPVACGTYIVNLDEKTVEAKDDLAKKIVKKTY